MSVVAFVMTVDSMRCEAKYQTFLGRNKGVPPAKKLVEAKRIDFVQTEFQCAEFVQH